jgi:hypothetical protein
LASNSSIHSCSAYPSKHPRLNYLAAFAEKANEKIKINDKIE